MLTMRRKTSVSFRLISVVFTALAALAALTALPACSTSGGGGSRSTSAPARYDFGALPDGGALAASSSALSSVPSSAPSSAHSSAHSSPAAIRLSPVTAPATLSSDAFQYRLRYADDQQVHVYAGSRWTEPPPQLLTARLRDRIARQGRVLDSSDGGPSVPVLKVELDEFSQVFDKPGESQGVVRMRATLLHGSTLIAQQSFTATSPAASADAVGGAHALSLASDAAIGQLLAWLAAQNP
jgi:cholesterol transport system auxiliary component